ncbi:MAG: rhodanese-like domain-containing protein [Magnetococcales bacterium]|nr:rhodanese-like domain-containing protein [Magnetococcales bacterium]
MKPRLLFVTTLLSTLWAVGLFSTNLSASNIAVKITRSIDKFEVKHGDKMVTVMRNQNTRAVITPTFALTSRKCPPFCIQPLHVAPGVNNMGEVELIHFMMTDLKAGTGLLIDARTPDWHARGTIPGSINIPYIEVSPSLGADEISIEDALVRLGAKRVNNTWDFSDAKKLVLWCNGPWCGQSPTAIRGLLELNYPAEKIFYYRGGMQSWQSFSLTVVPPTE